MPLLTSEAVLTELFHFTGANRGAMEAAWKFVRSGAVVVGTVPDAESDTPRGAGGLVSGAASKAVDRVV